MPTFPSHLYRLFFTPVLRYRPCRFPFSPLSPFFTLCTVGTGVTLSADKRCQPFDEGSGVALLASKLVSGLSVSTGIAFFALCAGLTLFALCAGLALFTLFSYKRCEPILQRTVKAGRESKLIRGLSVGTDCPGVALITILSPFSP